MMRRKVPRSVFLFALPPSPMPVLAYDTVCEPSSRPETVYSLRTWSQPYSIPGSLRG